MRMSKISWRMRVHHSYINSCTQPVLFPGAGDFLHWCISASYPYIFHEQRTDEWVHYAKLSRSDVRKGACGKNIRMTDRSVCACVSSYVCVCLCLCVPAIEYVPVWACRCTCLWAVTMLIGVSAIFDFSPQQMGFEFAGSSDECRKSHLQNGNWWEAPSHTATRLPRVALTRALQHHRSHSLPAAETSKLPFQFWCAFVLKVQWLGWVVGQHEWLWCQCHFMYFSITIMHTTEMSDKLCPFCLSKKTKTFLTRCLALNKEKCCCWNEIRAKTTFRCE